MEETLYNIMNEEKPDNKILVNLPQFEFYMAWKKVTIFSLSKM